MDFAFTSEQREIREAILKLCARFGDDYWLKKDKEGGFPHDFHQALAADGWLGIAMPEDYGGSGLGVTEAALMMQAIAESGAGMQGASSVHMNIFGLNPVVVFLSVLFWGWLWGIPGALLAVPIMATVKIFCDHVQGMGAMGEFLGK